MGLWGHGAPSLHAWLFLLQRIKKHEPYGFEMQFDPRRTPFVGGLIGYLTDVCRILSVLCGSGL